MDIPIYVINYKNEQRRNRMRDRFTRFGIEPIFTPPVEGTDSRLASTPDDCKRVWAVMLQHLDSIRHFYEHTTASHCIVCEDDIHIAKNFLTDLTEIIPIFDQLELDVLMLGYLLPFKIDMSTELHQQHFPIIKQSKTFTFHRYPDDIWGSQMYMLPRRYAEFMLEVFTVNYALENIKTLNFNPDWIMTKYGNRAMIAPMIAVEEGVNVSGDDSQVYYHSLCHDVNFNPDYYW